MGDAAKRRKRAKEKAKEARRRRGTSPWVLLGKRTGEVDVYVNADWRTTGLMSMTVFRPGLHGGYAAAVFLIDLFCLGLKDAFTREDTLPSETLARMESTFGAPVRMSLEDARRYVAGAIRWSREHRFRLPHDYEKAVAFLGGVGDTATADISAFAPGGKMNFVGTMDDLEERLIGRTAEEFLQNEGVDFTLEADPDDLDVVSDDEEEAEQVEDLVERVLAGTRQFCRAVDQEPHVLLPGAVPLVLAAMATVRERAPSDPVAAFKAEVERLLEQVPEPQRAPMEQAAVQVTKYLMLQGPDAEPMDEQDVEAIHALRDAVTALADKVRAWCQQAGQEPHPLLNQAASMVMAAAEASHHKKPKKASAAFVSAWDQAKALAPKEDHEALEAAGEQILQYMKATGPRGSEQPPPQIPPPAPPRPQ